MSNPLIEQLKELVIIPPEINDFDEILRLYDIDIRTIDKLVFIQKSLQNIVFLRELDTYAKINQACIEYLDNDLPNNQSSLSRDSSFSINSTTNVRGATPNSRYPSPLPAPPPKQPASQGQLAQLKGRPPALPQPAPVLRPPSPPPASAPPTTLNYAPISRPPSPPPATLKPASKLSPTAGPARLLLKKGPIRAPTPLRQSSLTPLQSRPVTPPLPTVTLPPLKVNLSTTQTTFNITVRNITLQFDKTHGLTLDGINSMLDRFTFENNGITIFSPIGSRFNKILYDSIINKDAFNITEITLEGNVSDEKYYHFKPK